MNILPTDQYLGEITDCRPGHYYVSAVDGSRWFPMAGPFGSHQIALGQVTAVRTTCEALDPRSAFMAFGTVRCDMSIGPGRLNILGKI